MLIEFVQPNLLAILIKLERRPAAIVPATAALCRRAVDVPSGIPDHPTNRHSAVRTVKRVQHLELLRLCVLGRQCRR